MDKKDKIDIIVRSRQELHEVKIYTDESLALFNIGEEEPYMLLSFKRNNKLIITLNPIKYIEERVEKTI